MLVKIFPGKISNSEEYASSVDLDVSYKFLFEEISRQFLFMESTHSLGF